MNEHFKFYIWLRKAKIEMEILLTEREGMLAENAGRLTLGECPKYGDNDFFELAAKMKNLVEEED